MSLVPLDQIQILLIKSLDQILKTSKTKINTDYSVTWAENNTYQNKTTTEILLLQTTHPT